MLAVPLVEAWAAVDVAEPLPRRDGPPPGTIAAILGEPSTQVAVEFAVDRRTIGASALSHEGLHEFLSTQIGACLKAIAERLARPVGDSLGDGVAGGPSPRLDVSVGSERQVPPESSESAPAEANWLVGGWFALSRHFSGAFRQTPRGRVPTTNKGAFLNVQNGSHVAQAGGDAADCQCGLQVLGREVWPVEQDVAQVTKNWDRRTGTRSAIRRHGRSLLIVKHGAGDRFLLPRKLVGNGRVWGTIRAAPIGGCRLFG